MSNAVYNNSFHAIRCLRALRIMHVKEMLFFFFILVTVVTKYISILISFLQTDS